MNPVLGTVIALILLAIPVFFAARYCFRDIKGALTGGSCTGCSGDCGSCGGGCSSCGTDKAGGEKNAGPKRYAINGKIVTIPGKEE